MAFKVAVVGAGSARCYRELMDLSALDGIGAYQLALHDPAPRRLAVAERLALRVAAASGTPCTPSAHAERAPALDGADVVLTSISVGMQEAIRPDFEIPPRYGLRQTVADTIGIGGIMRILRTAPVMAEIAADMCRYCPGGLLLNETNPLAMVGMALDRLEPAVRAVHLCHSPRRTATTLAGWLGVPAAELDCEVAGVNHQAWVLRLAHGGEDLYPRLRELARKGKDEDSRGGFAATVRADMLRRLGWFPTESSKHSAEYVPWYLPWDQEVKHYGLQLQVNPYWERRAHNVEWFADAVDLADGRLPLPLDKIPSGEYAPRIIRAVATGTEQRIYANLPNRDGLLLPVLPDWAVVEVPAIASREGVQPLPVGPLPPQCAALNRQYLNVCDLAVRAVVEGSREHVHHAAMLDPATAAALPLDDIERMVDELLDVHAATGRIPEALRR